MTRTRHAQLLAALTGFLLLNACGAPPTAGTNPPAPVSHVEITSDVLLLTAAGDRTTLRARAVGADQRTVPATVTWRSSSSDVQVDANGNVTATVPVGSATITAEARGVTSSVVVAVATPAENAVLIREDHLRGPVTAVHPDAPFGVGFQLRVPLHGAPPVHVGQVLINRGVTPVAGRVTAVNGSDIIIEVIPVDEVLTDIDVNERVRVPLTPAALPKNVTDAFHVTTDASGNVTFTQKDGVTLRSTRGTITAQKSEYASGPFTCESDGDVLTVDLAKTEVTLTPSIDLDVVWSDERRKVVVHGQPTASMDVKPTVSLNAAAKVGCRLTLAQPFAPLPGPLGLFLGATIPLGVGFELEGKTPLAAVGVETKAEVGLKYALGIDCAENCAPVTTLEPIMTGGVQPKFSAAQNGLVADVSGYGFLFAKLQFGYNMSHRLRVEALEAQAGLKLEARLATETHQAEQADVNAEYKLAFEGVIGSGKDFEAFMDLVKITTAKLELKLRKEFAWSPAGPVRMESPTFKQGDAVYFRVGIDEDKRSFPPVGDNVDAIRVYLRDPSGTQGPRLVLHLPVTPGRAEYVVPWIADVDSHADQQFVFFADTRALPGVGVKLGAVQPGRAETGCAPGVRFRVQELGGSDAQVVPAALNAHGDVVGGMTTDPASSLNLRAFLWRRGTLTALGAPDRTSTALTLNNTGLIAGLEVQGGGSVAGVVLNSGSSAVIGGADRFVPQGANDAGEIAGYVVDGTTYETFAAVYRDGVVTRLPKVGHGTHQAFAINARGEAVGTAAISGESVYAVVRWRAGVAERVALPGDMNEGEDINDHGDILAVSRSTNPSTGMREHRAYVVQNGTLTELGGLHAAGAPVETEPRAMNNAAQVVGKSMSASGVRGFLWNAGRLTDLNALLDTPLAEGWIVDSAEDINDACQIIGSVRRASDTSSAGTRGVILTPVQP